MVDSGGSELHAVRLAEGLRGRGHSVYCATLSTSTGGLTERYSAAGIPLLRFPVPRMVSLPAASQIRKAASQIRALGIEVVHAHDLYMNFFLSVAGRLAGVPTVVSKRWAFHERRAHRATDYVAYRLAPRVLANSAWVARSLVELDGVPPARVTTIVNFVRPDVFEARRHRGEWRDRFGFTSHDFVLGITAQLRSEKNHALLLESFARVHETNPRTRLLVVGDGPERQSLQDQVRALGLTDVVRFAGHVADAWRATAAMDLFVLPSKHEGFPNALLEAMAMGVPVAATSVGGIPDLVVDGVSGILLDRPTPVAIAEKLADVVRDEGKLSELAERARSFVVANHTESLILDRHEALYSHLLASPNAVT